MRDLLRGGFTFVELLVVIAIVVTFIGLLIPPGARSARETARKNTCLNNLRQLQLALDTRESTINEFPGYINALGDGDKKQVRASWVATILPYIEQQELWESWSQGEAEFALLEELICPSDPPVESDLPYLSYVANTGYVANANGVENKANGVFFDRTWAGRGAPGPQDERDAVNSPLTVMNNAYLQKHDGLSTTILLTENIHALHWGYVTAHDQAKTLDRKYHFGVCWEQPASLADAIAKNSPEQVRRINGNYDYQEHKSFEKIKVNEGFPTSNHPGGVNMVFAGGNVSFVNQDIDPLVYAQLMTSNHLESDLKDEEGKSESKIKQPDDADF